NCQGVVARMRLALHECDSPESRERFHLSEVEAEPASGDGALRDREALRLLLRARAEDSPALTVEGTRASVSTGSMSGMTAAGIILAVVAAVTIVIVLWRSPTCASG